MSERSNNNAHAIAFQALATLLLVPAVAAGLDPWLLLLTSPLLYANIFVLVADYILQVDQ